MKKELKKFIEENQIVLKFNTIQEVEDLLSGWDFSSFEGCNWHKKDSISSDRYYEVIIKRQHQKQAPEEDNYYVGINAYTFNGFWFINGDYSKVISYSDLLEAIDK